MVGRYQSGWKTTYVSRTTHRGRLESHAKSWAAEASWQLWKMVMGSDCPLGASSAGDPEGGKGLLGGSQIHWASTVWQRFRLALLSAMRRIHQSKKPLKRVQKPIGILPCPAVFHCPPVSASCHLPGLRAQFHFKPTAGTAVEGWPNAFRCHCSLAQKGR